MKLEMLLASSCRRKILITLRNVRRTHLTNLVRIVNSTYNQVIPQLRVLEQEGILSITNYRHMRIVELKMENPRTKALLAVLEILERADLET